MSRAITYLVFLVPLVAAFHIQFGHHQSGKSNYTVWKSKNHTVHHNATAPRNNHTVVLHTQVKVTVHHSSKNHSVLGPTKITTVFKPAVHSSTIHVLNKTGNRNGKHDFTWGTKAINDKLLYSTRVMKGSSLLRKTTTEVDFPPRHQRPNGTISYIQILDQEPVGQGGLATVVRGGVGYRNVTLRFKSKRSKPIDFKVDVYGH